MTNRRDFLRSAAAFTAGSFIVPSMISCGESKKTIGLQLYSVRDLLNADLNGTLKAVSQIGYNSLEAAGYNPEDRTFYGMAPADFAGLTKGMGMTLRSSHTIFEPDNAEKVCEDAAKAGVDYIIYPFLPEQFRQDLDGFRATADKFNQLGKVARKHGLRFGYHNHNFEFVKMEGQLPYDILLEGTDPSLVVFEVDLYWMTRGGYDPVEYFNKYPGRFELWHVKDMEKSEDMFFAPVGSGRIDFEKIFAEKKTSGMKYFFVEQDRFRDQMDPLKSIEMSYNYLSSAKFV